MGGTGWPLFCVLSFRGFSAVSMIQREECVHLVCLVVPAAVSQRTLSLSLKLSSPSLQPLLHARVTRRRFRRVTFNERRWVFARETKGGRAGTERRASGGRREKERKRERELLRTGVDRGGITPVEELLMSQPKTPFFRLLFFFHPSHSLAALVFFCHLQQADGASMVVQVLKGKGSGNEEWIESAGESTKNFEDAAPCG